MPQTRQWRYVQLAAAPVCPSIPDAEAILLPSSENATDETEKVWLSSCSPVNASQMRILLSQLPQRILLPLGDNATEVAIKVWQFNRDICFPVDAFQMRTLPSSLPLTILLLSGENATEKTPAGVPVQLRQVFACRCIPNADTVVFAGTDDLAAVGVRCNRLDRAGVAVQPQQLSSC